MADDFYQSHWREIEEERLARYEEMFVYRPQQEPLIAPLELEEGLTVADFGCGPGFLAMEFARRVGPTGRVFGLDINAEFVERATARAAEAGHENVSFVHLPDDRVPLEDATLDRLYCKNVLEYVPDVTDTLTEQFRVLEPGGLVTLVDSDWGFVIVEPWGKETTDRFFEAAQGAFNEPYIGRKLPALLESVGFTDVDVKVQPIVDRVGGAVAVIKNMVSYIERFETMPGAGIAQLMSTLDRAIESGTYMFVLPQFVVTGRRPR